MPNTNVKIKSGLVAGIIAGSIYQIIQWSYINFQIRMATYNAVYGSFAALPLFLIWLQLSWLTVLFGAELCFAHENAENYEFRPDFESISERIKKTVSTMIASAIYSGFNKKNSPMSDKDLSSILDLPIWVIRQNISILKNAGIILEMKSDTYAQLKFIPALPVENVTVSELIQKLETSGKNNIDYFQNSESFAKIIAIIDKYQKEVNNLGEKDKLINFSQTL